MLFICVFIHVVYMWYIVYVLESVTQALFMLCGGPRIRAGAEAVILAVKCIPAKIS
jgi:hypothetical protein